MNTKLKSFSVMPLQHTLLGNMPVCAESTVSEPVKRPLREGWWQPREMDARDTLTTGHQPLGLLPAVL